MQKILEYYSHCAAPTPIQRLQKELGMCDAEFAWWLKFKRGESDIWLIVQ